MPAALEAPGQRPERRRPAGLRDLLGEEAHGVTRERRAYGRDRLALRGHPPTVERARGLSSRGHPVHEDLVDRDAAPLQLPDGVPRLLDGQHLGQDDPPEPAAAAIAQETRQPARLGVQLGHEAVRRVAPVPAREPGEEEVVLGQHLPEHGRDPPQRLRDGQEPKRVSGGRRVDDDGVVPAGRRHPRELEEPAQLVHAGKAQAEKPVDVRVVEIGPALGDEVERAPAGAKPAGQRPIGVELEGAERRPAPGTLVTPAPTRCPSTSPSECAGSVDTTRVLWRAPAAAIARAAAVVVLPTPPFPPMNS